jgi:hypothetical protein
VAAAVAHIAARAQSTQSEASPLPVTELVSA